MDRKASDPRDKFYSSLSALPKDLYDFIEAVFTREFQLLLLITVACSCLLHHYAAEQNRDARSKNRGVAQRSR
jgi:hypothetical protein